MNDQVSKASASVSSSTERVTLSSNTSPRPIVSNVTPIRPSPVLLRPTGLVSNMPPRSLVFIRPPIRPVQNQSMVIGGRRILNFSPNPKINTAITTQPSPIIKPIVAQSTESTTSHLEINKVEPPIAPIATMLRNIPITMHVDSIHDCGTSSYNQTNRPVIHRLLSAKPKLSPGSPVFSPSSQQSNRTVTREMQVRVCRRNDRRLSVLRFNDYGKMDLSDGMSSGSSNGGGAVGQEVFLQRENNFRQYKATHSSVEVATKGAGSEYGREAKEEARLRRLGVVRAGYHADKQPWLLTVGKGRTAKRFRGVREGSVSANVRYFIFCQTIEGNFDAYPVHEWYKVNAEVNYRFLKDEEAEAEYTRRHKTMNLFNVMVKNRLADDSTEPGLTDGKESTVSRLKASLASRSSDGSQFSAKDSSAIELGNTSKSKTRRPGGFLLTELDEWCDLSDNEDDNSDDEVDKDEENKEVDVVRNDGDNTVNKTKDDDDDEAVGAGTGNAKKQQGSISVNKTLGSSKTTTSVLRRKKRAAAIVARKRRGTKQKNRRKKGALADSSEEDIDEDDEAWDESDPDDHLGDEVDYITDSSSDEEKLSADERDQIYEVAGVDEEEGLKALLTDLSDSDNSENDSAHVPARGELEVGDFESNKHELLSRGSRDDREDNSTADRRRSHHTSSQEKGSSNLHEGTYSSSSSSPTSPDASSSSSTSSDEFSDSDLAPDDPVKLARKAQKKAEMLRKITDKVAASSTKPDSSTPNMDQSINNAWKKRPAEEEVNKASLIAKRPKPNAISSMATTKTLPLSLDNELTVAVRKYLMRKPITVTELLKKIRVKKLVPKNDDAQTSLANALRQLRPIKQIINGQHVLSLKR